MKNIEEWLKSKSLKTLGPLSAPVPSLGDLHLFHSLKAPTFTRRGKVEHQGGHPEAPLRLLFSATTIAGRRGGRRGFRRGGRWGDPVRSGRPAAQDVVDSVAAPCPASHPWCAVAAFNLLEASHHKALTH